MNIKNAVLTIGILLQSSISVAIEVSGFVFNQNLEGAPSTIYINGEEAGLTDQGGYFQVEAPEGQLSIHAATNSAGISSASQVKSFYASEDIEVRLHTAPLRAVTINVAASEDEYGGSDLRRIYISEAVTPSPTIIQEDLQTIPPKQLPGFGSVHAKQFVLREGIYRASLRVSKDGSEEYDVQTGFQISSDTTEIRISVDDKYSSYPASNKIIDPSRVLIEPSELRGYLTIVGKENAATPHMALTVLNVQTGHYTWGSSRSDGSFELTLNGISSSEYTIYQRGKIDGWNNYQLGVGTTIRADLGSSGEYYFSTEHLISGGTAPTNYSDLQLLGGKEGGIAQFYGEYDFSQVQGGSSGRFTGSIDIVGPSLNDVEIFWGSSGIYIEKIVSADGWIVAANPENSSNFMTVSGLPINGEPELNRTQVGTVTYSEIEKISDNLWTAKFVADYEIPSQLSEGRYQIHVDKGGLSTTVSSRKVFSYTYPFDPSTSVLAGRVGEFEIGDTSETSIDIALLVNEYSNGSRGTVPEDRKYEFGITPGIITNTHKFIIDNSMPGRREGASYNLEPFIPLVSWTTKGHQVPMPVKFKFPSGKLEIKVTDPAGNSSTLGPHAFKGTYMNEPFMVGDTGGGMGGAAPQQYMKLATLSDDFEYNFDKYGDYQISLSGDVLDIYDRLYTLKGEFSVTRAEPLDLEFGVMPGTPYEVGDYFAPQIIVQPGLPAKVDITVSHYPNSDSTLAEMKTFSGFANRFGYYDGDNEKFQFNQPGEYRIDVLVSYEGKDGLSWAGSRTWGGIVESVGTNLEMRGVKGTEGYPNYRQWFVFDERPLGPGEANTHAAPPYQTGDISWMLAEELDRSNSAMTAFYTIFDKKGEFRDRVYNRLWGYSGLDFDNTGLPFVSSTDLKTATGSNINPFFDLNNSNDHWAYYYNASERPGVSAREHIGQLSTRDNYWRFSDTYNHQLGNGRQGDSPNDFKFVFGGGVYRMPQDAENHYLGYGSLWVHLPLNDEVGGRIMPPFQGAAGGPSGGPLFTLLGEDVDIFFHPMGVRPGSILEVGDIAAFSGQVAPTLASEVLITVTTPSKGTRTIQGTANKIGYFYKPETDFLITEPGVYDVAITVTHKGNTSSGFVEAPFPTGGILSSDIHNFKFYVVTQDSDEAVLSSTLPTKLPQSTALDFSFDSPKLSSNTQFYQTTVMPGFVLSQSDSYSPTYSYNATELNVQFPNLDIGYGAENNVDTVTYSFMLETQDEKGDKKYSAQQILLQGDQIIQAVRDQRTSGAASIEIENLKLGAGRRLKANLAINAQGFGDLYVVLMLPDSSYISLGETKFISEIGEVIPFRENINLLDLENLPLVDISLPSGLLTGTYTFYAVIVESGAEVLDSSNWVSISGIDWSYD
tara:strand:- start:841 stop:5004 length:4164 start_codon:yes stop_codon:yes gene_type:complete